MPADDIERLRSIKTLPSLIKYLRDELDWPIESEDLEDLTFEYEPEELGIDPKTAVKIKEIKQLRPLTTNQPWGIFWINFEPKYLPIVVLRRILGSLVIKKRASANKTDHPSWAKNDLLFIGGGPTDGYGGSISRASGCQKIISDFVDAFMSHQQNQSGYLSQSRPISGTFGFGGVFVPRDHGKRGNHTSVGNGDAGVGGGCQGRGDARHNFVGQARFS